MDEEIFNVQLLFRASENEFSAKRFHTRCDGKNNTLTVAKTEFGNIVAGFCSIPWKSPKQWEYLQDHSNQTFLLSLKGPLKGLKFQPIKKKFTIAMHS